MVREVTFENKSFHGKQLTVHCKKDLDSFHPTCCFTFLRWCTFSKISSCKSTSRLIQFCQLLNSNRHVSFQILVCISNFYKWPKLWYNEEKDRLSLRPNQTVFQAVLESKFIKLELRNTPKILLVHSFVFYKNQENWLEAERVLSFKDYPTLKYFYFLFIWNLYISSVYRVFHFGNDFYVYDLAF